MRLDLIWIGSIGDRSILLSNLNFEFPGELIAGRNVDENVAITNFAVTHFTAQVY